MDTRVQDSLTDQVAEEIRALLARRRMSGRQLAAALGVSPSWISYRLTGTQEIGLNELARIARALNVSIAELLPREAPNERSAPSAERMTPHAAIVKSSPERMNRRRPKLRQSAGQPIPMSVAS